MTARDPPGRRPSGALSPEDWARLEALVDALLDTPLERRTAMYEELSAGDAARRAELERLVAECERSHALLDEPAAERFAALVGEEAERASAVLEGRYRISHEVGRGGMATVYLARDLRHSRDVAIKVVHAEFAAALGGGRFVREIEIAAGLRHPNIVPVYDSGEVAGLLYYVMPYETDRSLRDRLVRDGPLPLDDALPILRDVCDALAHAHRYGIVHRDVKPDNVLLSGRHAMVSDFGVAKAIAAAHDDDRPAQDPPRRWANTLTQAGRSLGTPAYMAPEQIVADPGIDHRADIYGFGVLAYELLAGQPPFVGDEPQSVLAAHLTQPPEPITVHRPELPPALAEIVMRCLEKKPADRWQSADEVLARLEQLATPGAPGARLEPATPVAIRGGAGRMPSGARAAWYRRALASAVVVAAVVLVYVGLDRSRSRPGPAALDPAKIVIVPFRVLGIDSSLRYLSEGVVDLLAAKLTGDGGPAAVDARTAISAWKQVTGRAEGTADHARLVARRVGAAEALSGSIISLPDNRLTITASVIPAEGETTLPAVTLRGSIDSLPSLLDGLATRLVARRAGVSEKTLGAITSESVPALRAYLWGREEYRRGHDAEAVEHFARAVDLDSTFALAALDLVVAVGQPLGMRMRCPSSECLTTYFAVGFRNPGPESDHRRLGRAVEVAWRHRDKLSARDRPLLEALRGDTMPDRNTARIVVAALRRAATAAPDRAETHYLLGSLLLYQGPALEISESRAQAAAEFRRALQLDPAYAAPMAGLVEVAAFDRDTDALRRVGAQYLALDSVGAAADYVRWRVAVGVGDSVALSSIRARFDSLDGSTLQRIIHASLMSGLDLADAVRASPILVDRAADPVQRRIAFGSAYTLAMNRGRPREAAVLLQRRAQVLDDPLALWTWGAMSVLFWDGDSAIARATVRARSALIARDTLDASRHPGVRSRDLARHISQQGLWYVMHGDTARAATLVRWLQRNGESLGATFVDVQLASGAGRPDAGILRARLDSVALEGCCTTTVVHWVNLVVARAHEAAGHDADALRAVRRGVWRFPPQLLSTFLRDEGRLAAKLGDGAGAIRAYRHYLTLRAAAEPAMSPEIDRVRAELASLEQHGRSPSNSGDPPRP